MALIGGLSQGARTTGYQFPNQYFSKEIWDKNILRKFDDILVMQGCVNRDYEGQLTQPGDVVHVRSIGDITLSNYSRGQKLVRQSLDEGKTTITIDQQKYFDFAIDKLDRKQFDIEIENKYINRAAVASQLEVDTYLQTLGIAGASSDNYYGTSGSPILVSKDGVATGSTSILDAFIDIFEILRESKTLVGGERPFIVIPPALEGLVKKSPDFTAKSTEQGDKWVRDGVNTIGSVAGLVVKVTTNLGTYLTGHKQYKCFFGTNKGLTFASALTELDTYSPPDEFSVAVKGLYLYGGKMVYPAATGVAFLKIS